MAVTLAHTFVSAIADDSAALAAGEICPQAHWNANHTFAGLSASGFLTTSGASVLGVSTYAQALALLNPMTTGGDLIYGGASGLQTRLPNGTVGQALLSQGTTLPPAWTTLPGGGDALTSNPLSQFAATTSAQLAGVLTDETGTGVFVRNTSPTFVTPVLGVAAGTSWNGLTLTASTGTFTLTNAKTLAVSNSMTFTATDGSTIAFVGGGTVLYNGGALGTPASGTATNITGLPEAGLSLTDITTNNVSTTKHGFAPKLPNDATKYLDGTGGYTVPAGGGGSGTVTHTVGALAAHCPVLGNGSADILTVASAGTAGQPFLSGGASADGAYGALDLAGVGVTGVLPAVINAQTGTSYTVVSGDNGKIITFSNGSAIAVTLPQATGSFTTGWACTFKNKGAGAVTITPTTSTIGGAATLVLPGTGTEPKGASCGAASDGTNYQTTPGVGISGLSLTTTGSSGAATLAAGVLNIPQYSGGGSATPGLVIGCQPIWTSVTQLSIGSGQLYIESSNSIIAVAAQTITPSSPANSTWYHGYVNSSGTFAVSTTAPVAFATACGFARSKTSDTASRYVGSFRTDGSGNFYQFACDQAGYWRWKGQNLGSGDFRCLTNGTATSSTSVDLSAVVPLTARMAYIGASNTGVGAPVVYLSSGDITASASAYDFDVLPTTGGVTTILWGSIPLSSTQTINYINSGASGGSYVDVAGFWLQR